MLVCDMCDKGYHTFCLQPAIDSLPTNGWRCQVGKKLLKAFLIMIFFLKKRERKIYWFLSKAIYTMLLCSG